MFDDYNHIQSRLVYQIHNDSDVFSVTVESPYHTLGVNDSSYSGNTKPVTQYARDIYAGCPYEVAILFADNDSLKFKHACFHGFIEHRNSFLTKMFVQNTVQQLQDTSQNHSNIICVGHMILRWLDGDIIQLTNSISSSALELSYEINERLDKCILPLSVNPVLLNNIITSSIFSYWSYQGEM